MTPNDMTISIDQYLTPLSSRKFLRVEGNEKRVPPLNVVQRWGDFGEFSPKWNFSIAFYAEEEESLNESQVTDFLS